MNAHSFVRTPAGCAYMIPRPDLPWSQPPEGLTIEPAEATVERVSQPGFRDYLLVVIVPEPVDQVTLTWPRQLTTGYVLADEEALSARFPARLSLEEWQARPEHQDEQETLTGLYRRETAPAWTTHVIHLEAAVELPVEWTDPPELPEGMSWHPDAWAVAAYGGTVGAHLLPGHLSGLRVHILDAYMAHPWRRGGLLYHDDPPRVEGSGAVKLPYRVPYSPPRTGMHTTGSGRSRRKVRQEEFRSWEWAGKLPPDGVAAANLADALERHDQLLAQWVETTSPPDPRPCGHCAGLGFVLEEASS